MQGTPGWVPDVAHGSTIQDSMNCMLNRSYEMEPRNWAHISIDKSPGPDGYTSVLISHWEFIGEDLVRAVKEFFYYKKAP